MFGVVVIVARNAGALSLGGSHSPSPLIDNRVAIHKAKYELYTHANAANQEGKLALTDYTAKYNSYVTLVSECWHGSFSQ